MVDTAPKTQADLMTEYAKKIEYLENLARALYSKGVKVSDGKVDVTMSATDLEKLVDIEKKLFEMKLDLQSRL